MSQILFLVSISLENITQKLYVNLQWSQHYLLTKLTALAVGSIINTSSTVQQQTLVTASDFHASDYAWCDESRRLKAMTGKTHARAHARLHTYTAIQELILHPRESTANQAATTLNYYTRAASF
jgi:NADP-dependent 3-hydroxy acid dehydrogenase YdfG